jgi:CubicO group peptidase (beta-lactamase class C family)
MPAEDLFSTATDVARFYRMILNDGTLDGLRFLSEPAVTQMTSKQTGDALKDSYGIADDLGAEDSGPYGCKASEAREGCPLTRPSVIRRIHYTAR